MSLNIDNIGSPQGAALQAIKAQQAQAAVLAPVAAQQDQSAAAIRPASQQSEQAASAALKQFTAAAQSAAGQLRADDPMKPVAEGIAQDLSRAGGDAFNAMGRINDLQNAFTFAMEANAGLMNDPALATLA